MKKERVLITPSPIITILFSFPIADKRTPDFINVTPFCYSCTSMMYKLNLSS